MTFINDSLVNIDYRDNVIPDLLEEADKGLESIRIVRTNHTTLNTPYTDGLTDIYVAGTAIILMTSVQYGSILYLTSGKNQMFVRVKNDSGWSDWDEYGNTKTTIDMTKIHAMRVITGSEIAISSGNSVYSQKLDIPVLAGYKPYVIAWFRLIGTGYANCSLSELWIDPDNNQIVYGIRNNGPEERNIKLCTRVMYINTSVLNV